MKYLPFVMAGVMALAAVAAVAAGAASSSAERIVEAQAAVEAVREAGVVTPRQGIRASTLAAAVIGLACLAAGLAAALIWVVIRQRGAIKLQATAGSSGRWVSGPNARWGRSGGDSGKPGVSDETMNRMIQLRMLETLNGSDQKQLIPAQDIRVDETDDNIQW